MLRFAQVGLATALVAGFAGLVGRAQTALDPRVENFATLPSAGATENIGQAPDGSIYVTGMDDKVLWKVTPSGRVEKFADVPGVAVLLGVGPDGSIYSSSGTTMFKVSPDGQVSKYLENVPGGPATLVSGDGKWVYWPTRGGTTPQRVLRTAIH